MRSKNSVPVQVILPQTQMSSNHSVERGAFEEALQSSIEASLRTSGAAPTLRVFSSLYRRSRPHSADEDRPGPSSAITHSSLLPPPDNGETDLDVKPDVSDLNREIARQSQNVDEQQSPERTSSTHSTASPREQQGEASFMQVSRGPPPLLMPQTYLRAPAATTSSGDLSTLSNNRQLLQRHPSMIPKNIPIEQLKQAQEQVKQLQQIHRWHFLQQRQQQARAAVANSLSIPRLPLFNPLMPTSVLNSALMNPGSAINGAHSIPQQQESSSTANNQQQSKPGSPMFRKGYCKGGKDIRLSTLKRDGTTIMRYASDYTLVAMSISPSSPQVVKPSGGYHPPDIPSEAMVVVAISIKCLPPHQHELSRPLLAKCIGCGESLLHTFATLSSHINLRTVSPSHTNISLSGVNPLQRHARNFVIRDNSVPHGCVRGPIIPWHSNDITPPRMTQPGMLPMLPTGGAPHRPNTGANPQSPVPQAKYKINQNDSRNIQLGSQPTRPNLLPPGGVSITHRDLIMKVQPTTSVTSPIPLDSLPANGPRKEQNLSAEWSPISSGPSEQSPTSDALVQSRVDPDWNSTVKLPENLPTYVGRPLILVCWEWQQLQSNIPNVHITHSYMKCFDEALAECQHTPALTPLSKELCCFVTAQYLASLDGQEFPTPSQLSAWLGRSRLMFASMRHIQMTTPHTVALVRTIISNCLHKMGMVISQISQAHAINECIANLKPAGPRFHIIAHINGNTILDLAVLITGQASRLSREYLLTSDERSEMIQQNSTLDNLLKVDKEISASALDTCIDSFSARLLSSPNTSRKAFAPSTGIQPFSSTSSSSMTRHHQFLNSGSREPPTSSTTKVEPLVTSDENNNNTSILLDHDERLATELSEKLFSHVSSLCNEQKRLDLSQFSSIQLYFLLPPSPVYKAEATRDVTSSNVFQELGIHQTQPTSPSELQNWIFSASLKSKQRFHTLCENVKANTSTLFFIFCLDAHFHCDSSSVGSEWMSTLINEIMPHYRNLLLISCTHIPQALLNQNTSVPFKNVLFSTTENANSHSLGHCPTLKFTDVTYEPKHEAESVTVMDSLPEIHSSVVNAKLLVREYIAALALNTSSGGDYTPDSGRRLSDLTSPITMTSVRELLSANNGSTVLVRIPSEILAARFASEMAAAREKLKMQEAFEIMLFGSHTKLQLSNYFLHIIRNQMYKTNNWVPESLSEVNCIPLLLIYTGRDITDHLLPRNIRYVDLRLVGSNCETLTQSQLLSELSLAEPSTQKTTSVINNTHHNVECGQPPSKKAKSDSDDDALHMDTFSEDSGSGKENKLQWKSFDERENEVKEFSSDEEETVNLNKPNKKRGFPVENDVNSVTEGEICSATPTIIVSKNIHAYIKSYLKGTQKFNDLTTHKSCEWSSHARTVISEKITDAVSAAYFRKWTKPVLGHPDFSGADRDTLENARSILLVTPPRMRTTLACCLFAKRMNQTLAKLLQVEVYDHKPSSTVKPRYPLPNVDLLPEYPVHTTILDMDFDTSVMNSMAIGTSQIANGLKDLEMNSGSKEQVDSAPCMTGKFSALDAGHQVCNSCKSQPNSQIVTIHLMSVPKCGINQQCVSDRGLSLNVNFVIPECYRHHFIFHHLSDNKAPQVMAINLRLRDDSGIKTPVFSLGVSGAEHGLYNLDHTLSNVNRLPSSDSDDGVSNDGSDVTHVIVVRDADSEDFKRSWPNKILMILPESLDDLGIGAMKYVVQCVMQQSVSVREEQQNNFMESSTLGDIWPFALMLDDSCVLWTGCAMPNSSINSNDDVEPSASTKQWRNISLLNVLERIESVPCVERYASIGFRPWSANMKVPKSEEDFSGEVVSSGFSKCILTSCFAINASSTKEEMFDYSKFSHEDVDWFTRIAAADLPLFRFNDIAVAVKVIASQSRNEITSVPCESPQGLVSLADSDFKPIPRHPSHLLEGFLSQLGHTVFPKAGGNSRHPVLVVDHYISLGPEVYVEFASSKPHALPWAMDTEKTYSGLLLYGQSSDMSPNFLQQFQFINGATVCVVGRDRSSLRQTVVNLHLENDWHFRLTDEYQTSNDVGKRKPLFYLTGVARSMR